MFQNLDAFCSKQFLNKNGPINWAFINIAVLRSKDYSSGNTNFIFALNNVSDRK